MGEHKRGKRGIEYGWKEWGGGGVRMTHKEKVNLLKEYKNTNGIYAV